MSPEQQITARVQRAGKDFLRTRREFAAASEQADSMNAAQIAKSKAKLGGKQRNPKLLPKGVAFGGRNDNEVSST